jgi:hypothetical protein
MVMSDNRYARTYLLLLAMWDLSATEARKDQYRTTQGGLPSSLTLEVAVHSPAASPSLGDATQRNGRITP